MMKMNEGNINLEPLLITQQNFAMMLGLTISSFQQMRNKGQLPDLPEPIRISKKTILYKMQDVKDYVERLPKIMAKKKHN